MKKNDTIKSESNESEYGYDYKVTNIDWDVDDTEDLDNLPESIIVTVPEEICAVEEEEEWISDYLSDTYGFCNNGFSCDPIGEIDESIDIRKHRFVPRIDTSTKATKAMKSMKDKERERERRDWNQRLRNGDFDDYDDYDEYDESIMDGVREIGRSVKDGVKDAAHKTKKAVKRGIKKIGDVIKGPFRKGDHVTISGGDGESVQATITKYELGGKKYEVMLQNNYDESHNGDWFGILGAKYIYHGDWADPEIHYDGVSLNYNDVEDMLLAEYREEHPEDRNDDGFDDWMALPETKSSIQSALDDLVQGGCGEPLDEYDRDDEIMGDYMI